MQSKRLKLWIILGSVLTVLMISLLFLTLNFRLKTVNVEFQSRLTQEETMLPSGIQDNVKTYFKTNGNIILMKFDNSISKIEKEYPFLKVNQVIKYFPRTIGVYISERIPKYRVQDSLGMWLILDEDFKVLDKVSNDDLMGEILYRNSTYFERTVEILDQTIYESIEKGSFLNNYNIIKDDLNLIMSGVYGKTEDYLSVNSILVSYNEGKSSYKIIMRNVALDDGNGCNILIDGTESLKEKVYVGVSTFQAELQKDSTINTPKTSIKIYHSNGEYKGIKIVDED